jgi:hypothetical protein
MTKKNGFVFLRFLVAFLIVLVMFSRVAVAADTNRVEQTDYVYLPFVAKDFRGSGDLPPGDSIVEGFVYNFLTNAPVDGANVCLEDTSLCDLTGGDGLYQLNNVPTGTYTFTASVTGGYDNASKELTVQSETTHELDFGLLPWPQEEELRVVLTWNSTPTFLGKPNDLNLHAWIRSQGDYRIDIGNMGDCSTIEYQFPFACYETNTQYGSGPDSIILANLDEHYTFAVLNYYAAEPGWPSITALEAKVKVYTNSGVLEEYQVPTTGDGDLWYVFDYDRGDFFTQNCIVTFDQSGDIPPVCP